MKNKYSSNSSTQIEEEEEEGDREKELYTKNRDKREVFSHTKRKCHSTTI
jgi:hypothetical protein